MNAPVASPDLVLVVRLTWDEFGRLLGGRGQRAFHPEKVHDQLAPLLVPRDLEAVRAAGKRVRFVPQASIPTARLGLEPA